MNNNDQENTQAINDTDEQLYTEMEPDNRTFWQKLFSFKGRIDRGEYWKTIFIRFVLLVPSISYLPEFPHGNMALFALSALALLLGAYIALAAIVKRIHDFGYSGWFALLMLIPIANGFIELYLALGSGDDNDNRYGPAE